MTNHSKVLWVLDNEVDDKSFERLCVDLLAREEYGRIIPVGGKKDHGRDAETIAWSGKSKTIFFQFSLQDTWEKKLREDADKIIKYGHTIDHFVYVTPQTVTGTKNDILRKEFRTQYGWELTILSREWLRNRLEERNPDLAQKYLGIEVPQTPYHVAMVLATDGIDSDSAELLFRNISPEQVKAQLSDKVKTNASDPKLWKGLASIEYHLQQYDEALRAVNMALKILPTDVNFTLLKGAILAEKGIKKRSRPLLLQAKDIFSAAVLKLKRPFDHYNLANILSPLGELDEAERHYRLCLNMKPEFAQAWKNLGSVLFRKGQHTEEMACYEQALKLQPNLVEAYICKGTTLLNALDNPVEAIKCFEKAYEVKPELDKQWPHTHYWFSRACYVAGQFDRAVKEADTGLLDTPDSIYLLNQKGAALSHLWRQDESRRKEALDFFKSRARVLSNDYGALHEISQIMDNMGIPNDAWPVLDEHLDCRPYSFIELCQRTGLTLQDVELGLGASLIYRRFRSRYGFEDYVDILHVQGLQPDDTMLMTLQHLLMMPFGIALRGLQAMPPHKQIEILPQIFDTLFGHLARIFPVFGSKWLSPSKPVTAEEQTLLLSTAMPHFAEVVLMETSRQFGFITGMLHLNTDASSITSQMPLSQMCINAGATLVANVAQEWKLFRNE